MTRNPLLRLADIIGFNTGAYTGALLVLLAFTSSAVSVTTGMVGGLVTAALVYALAFKGGLLGFRLIVVGIAVGAMLNALNAWILVAAKPRPRSVPASGPGQSQRVRWPQVMPVLWSW